jgi:hypothetical protein
MRLPCLLLFSGLRKRILFGILSAVRQKSSSEVTMKRIFLIAMTVFVLGALAAQAEAVSTVSGWISDTMCGAKHTGGGEKCVKSCIETMGAKPVFVDEAKKAVWAIDNPGAVKAFWGTHVVVKATVDVAKKSVHIETIAAAK